MTKTQVLALLNLVIAIRLLEVLDNFPGGNNTDVGKDESFLKFVDHIGIDLATQETADATGKGLAGSG